MKLEDLTKAVDIYRSDVAVARYQDDPEAMKYCIETAQIQLQKYLDIKIEFPKIELVPSRSSFDELKELAKNVILKKGRRHAIRLLQKYGEAEALAEVPRSNYQKLADVFRRAVE